MSIVSPVTKKAKASKDPQPTEPKDTKSETSTKSTKKLQGSKIEIPFPKSWAEAFSVLEDRWIRMHTILLGNCLSLLDVDCIRKIVDIPDECQDGKKKTFGYVFAVDDSMLLL